MNKEEIENMFETLTKQWGDTDNYVNDLLSYSRNLQQENKQLKEIIDTIFNWNIFKNECPMNFAYDKETNEDKAQETFFENDDYCENNCNDDYKKCWLRYFRKMQELENGENND